jgi:alpha-beta hydrolase superfamily lysophospholipase/SAM-dependent methyltransferase
MLRMLPPMTTAAPSIMEVPSAARSVLAASFTRLPEQMPAIRGGLVESEHTFASFDGTRIFFRAWIPETGFDKVVLLLHRGHEHSARLAETARALRIPGAACFAWDERGHGNSPGERGWAADFSVYARDLDQWVRHLSMEYDVPVPQFSVVAHSVAAVIASAWVHDYAPQIRSLVLATPAFRVKLYLPFAIAGLRLLNAIRPGSFIKSYVGGRLLTTDPECARDYDNDRSISRNISLNILLGLYDTASRLIADTGAIQTPVLLLSGGSDFVVENKPQARFFAQLSSPVKRMETLRGFRHALFHEKGRALVWERVSAFIRDQYETDSGTPSLLGADQRGYTRLEYNRLSQPLPAWSPRRWSFAIQKAVLNTLGRLSHSVSVGWRCGFDSGESLDAVYENEPRGVTFLGRLFDRAYLQAIGWRGIRQRKVHLQRAVEAAVRAAYSGDQLVRVVDIASGPGRYLLELISQHPELPIQAECRDRSASGLAVGTTLAELLHLKSVTFTTGDAFDTAALANLTPRPDVAIVSGLYELFPLNEPIRASLKGLHDALPDGGWLIYTNQPWHPQVEMIARVLPNREMKPWIMRRRTQAEMDELVRAAGFEKIGMEIDQWGIFSVSVARKLPLS